MNAEQVICINSEGYEVSLMVHKTYPTIPDEEAAQHGLIRVIDETEEDYLYPASHFVAVESVRDSEGQSPAAAIGKRHLEGVETMATSTVKRIVCLANSRKTGGYCVAGKEILENEQIGGWIRPVSHRDKEEVSWSEQRFENGGIPRPLDVIDVPVLSHNPKDYQRENWLLDPQHRWGKVRSASASDLHQLADPVAPLWINGYSTSNGQHDQVPQTLVSQIDNSLRLIKVDDLEISVYDDYRRQVRGTFSHCGAEYTLSITDPVYGQEYRQGPDGNYSIEDCFLTVSLGDMWGGFAYKLIAAIIKP